MNMTNEIFYNKVRPLFSRSVFCSIATTSADGLPHVTPIGSVVLNDKSSGWFFQKFTQSIPKNSETCEYATIMAVNDGNWFWLKSVLMGTFKKPPAMRLLVKLGELRPANEKEANKFQRRVGIFRKTKGYRMMWQDMSDIREFEIIEYKPVNIGAMTKEQFN